MIRLNRVLEENFPGASLVLQVHDSLIIESPDDLADEIERALVETMEGVKYIDVPLKADPKRGKSLAGV
jgi:DNA polymerase-1